MTGKTTVMQMTTEAAVVVEYDCRPCGGGGCAGRSGLSLRGGGQHKGGCVMPTESNVQGDALWLMVKTQDHRTVSKNDCRLLAVGGWRLAAVGGWRLAVGGWRLVVLGCGPQGLSLTTEKWGLLGTALGSVRVMPLAAGEGFIAQILLLLLLHSIAHGGPGLRALGPPVCDIRCPCLGERVSFEPHSCTPPPFSLQKGSRSRGPESA